MTKIDTITAKAAALVGEAAPAADDGYTGPSGARITITSLDVAEDGASITIRADLPVPGMLWAPYLVFRDQGRGLDDGAMLDCDDGDYAQVVAALAGADASPEALAHVQSELEMLVVRAIGASATSCDA
jgi:hypothetical protein